MRFLKDIFANKKTFLIRFFILGIFIFITSVILFSSTNQAEAYQCVAVAGTNNWNSPSAWTSCNNSYPGSPTNGTTDTVTIPNTAVVLTANTDVTVGWITFTTGTSASSISINNGVILNVRGVVTINAPTATVTKEVLVGSGTLVANGISIVGGSAASRIAKVSASTGTITTTAGITMSGTAAQAQLTTTGAATINLTGVVSGGTLSIHASTILVSNSTSTISTASTWGLATISSGSTLTLGGVAVTFGGLVSINGTLTTSSATGTVTFSNGVTINNGGVLSFSGFAKVTSWTGNIVMNGTTFHSGTGATTLAAGTYALSGSSDITFGGAVTVIGTVTNSNTAIVTSTGNFTGAGSWTQGAGSTLRLGGSTANTVTTFNASSNPNTIDYFASGTQTCNIVQYYHLKFSGTSAKTCALTADVLGNVEVGGTSSWTLSTAFNINGNLLLSGGSMTTGAVAFTVSGMTTITSGTLSLTNNTGAKTFTGQIVLNGGTLSGASNNIIIGTGIMNNSGVVSISGAVTITAIGVTFSGVNTISIATITVNNPGTVINNGTVSVSTTLVGAGSWTQGVSSTLSAAGADAAAIAITTLNAYQYPNIVRYNSISSTQTCKVTQYYTLKFYGTNGSKTCNPDNDILGDVYFESGNGNPIWAVNSTISINGNLYMDAGQIITTSSNYPFLVSGVTDISGTASFYCNGSGTVTLVGMVTITTSGTVSCSPLQLWFQTGVTNNSVTLGYNSGFSNVLVNTPGVTFSGTGETNITRMTVNSPGTVINNGKVAIGFVLAGAGTWIQGTGSTLTVNAVGNVLTITNLDASTNPNTIAYSYASGGTQIVKPITYYNLTLITSTSMPGIKTLTGVTTVLGDFYATGNFTADLPITTIGGNFTTEYITNYTTYLTLSATNVSVGGNVTVGITTTLVAPTGILSIGGDFTRVGSFVQNNGTVEFNNASRISTVAGNITFYKLAISTAGKTAKFTSGEVFVVESDITITGESGNNAIITSTTGSSQFGITYTGSSQNINYATVSWAGCTRSRSINVYSGSNTNAGNNDSCWLFTSSGTVTISGTANGNEGQTVKAAVGHTLITETGIIFGGTWSISGVDIALNDSVVVWIDNVSETEESNALTVYDGSGDITGMVLDTNTLSIGSGDTVDINVGYFRRYDTNNDEDLIYSGSFLGANLDIGQFNLTRTTHILSNSVLRVNDGEIITFGNLINDGSIVLTDDPYLIVHGSWTNNGTFNSANSTTTFISNNNNLMSGNLVGATGKFYNINFDYPGGQWTASDPIEVANNFTIDKGQFNLSDSLTVSGNYSNYDKFISGSGTVILNPSGTKTLSGDTSTIYGKFYNLTMSGSGTVTSLDDVVVDGDLQVNSGTFDGNGNLTVKGGDIIGDGTVLFLNNKAIVNPQEFATGTSFTCALTKNTSVYCWGSNSFRSLGNGTTTSPYLYPGRVVAGQATGADTDGTYLINIKHIYASSFVACAVSNTGNAYCWGYAPNGQLGDGQTSTNRSSPVKVLKGTATGSDTDGTYLTNIKSLSLGSAATCATMISNNIYCWGSASSGNLGNGTTTPTQTTPVRVLKGVATGADTDGTNLINIKQISLGNSSACAISYSDVVYCWGNGSSGQLGNGATTSSQTTPVRVVKGVATGSDTDGTYLKNINQIDVTGNESCGVSNSGYIYCWGSGSSGELGNATTTSAQSSPVLVLKGAATGSDSDGTYLINQKNVQVGVSYVCAVSQTSTLHCWGQASSGKLGDGQSSTNRTSPVKVLTGAATGTDSTGANLTNIKYIAPGSQHTCALSNAGHTYCWGDATDGALGDGQTSPAKTSPFLILADTSGYKSLVLGNAHTCGLTNLGTVYCWGQASSGKLGDGQSSTDRTRPVQVLKGAATGSDTDGTYLINIRQISGESDYMCALAFSGYMYCWGGGSSGQLGNGTTTSTQTTPVLVLKGAATGADTDGTYLVNIIQLSSGSSTSGHNCAISASGFAYCWGAGGSGQLGDGMNNSPQTTPVKVLAGAATGSDTNGTYLVNVRQISISSSYTCAITFESNAYCWGSASSGQLGNGTTTPTQTTPVRVLKGVAIGNDTDGTYLVNMNQIIVSSASSCAIAYSGYTYCWGNASNGRLGDGQASINRTTPVRVLKGEATGSDSDGTYLINVKQINGGGSHVCAVTFDSNTYCWGTAANGRLGDGQTSLNRTSPVKVLKGAAYGTGDDAAGVYLNNQKYIIAGGSHTCSISNTEKLYCWGLQTNGRLGDNQILSNRTSPIFVITTEGDTSIRSNAVTLNGTGGFGGNAAWSFSELQFGSGSSGVTTSNGSGSITIYGSLTNSTDQTMYAGSKTYTIGNNFTNSGTFNGDASTVLFNNTDNISTIIGSGSTNFYDFKALSPGKVINFTTDQTFVINGTVTITGSSSDPIILTSTGGGQWNITQNGSENITYANISWSTCIGGHNIKVHGDTNIDGGNNGPCWLFIFSLNPRGGGRGSTDGGIGTGNISINNIITGSGGPGASNDVGGGASGSSDEAGGGSLNTGGGASP